MTRVLAVVAALALAGCASVGNPVYKQDYEQVRVGQTTIAEVIENFGPPTVIMRGSNDVECTWEWHNSNVKAVSFIPGAGLVGVAGTEGRRGIVTALFDGDGILRILRNGGSDFETTGGSVLQGYKTTGKVKAVDTTLPVRPTSQEAVSCKVAADPGADSCPKGERCIGMPGRNTGYCVPLR
jgi:hypothetical protein